MAEQRIFPIGFILPEHLTLSGIWPDLGTLEHHTASPPDNGIQLRVSPTEESACPLFAGYGLASYMSQLVAKVNAYKEAAGEPPMVCDVTPWLFISSDQEMELNDAYGEIPSIVVSFWRKAGNVPAALGNPVPIYGPTVAARQETLLRYLETVQK